MDIVDNIVIVFKYNKLNLKKRHVSSSANISSWFTTNVKFINKTTAHLLYLPYINQKNVPLLIKLIKLGINVTPIIYWMKIETVNLLNEHCVVYNNLNVLKKINIFNTFNNEYLNELLQSSSENGNLKIIKLIGNKITLHTDNFRSKNNYCLRLACRNNHFAIIKYLHKKINLTINDFRAYNNEACRFSCDYGHINIVKYIHKHVKLTITDFRSENNYACKFAEVYDVIRYLYEEIGLTKYDFRMRYITNKKPKTRKYINNILMN